MQSVKTHAANKDSQNNSEDKDQFLFLGLSWFFTPQCVVA